MIAVLHYKKRSPPAQQTRCWWWCSIFEEVLTKVMTDVTDVCERPWVAIIPNFRKSCVLFVSFFISLKLNFLKLFLTLHTPVSSKKGKVFLVSHSDKVISELFGYQSRLLWYRWLCVRAHDVGLGSLNAVNSVSVLFCANHFDSSVP